ncbi:hypothetical protein [Streptomyces sp. NRRL S-646]|uniref:hypothetical protein n=1 Tax=Streptomyces sp. NRRL S-646 TaxID=1463917 RepID=UPI001331B430|nr:hypothetical protein [Streptomyces sp. NRRL S-646]
MTGQHAPNSGSRRSRDDLRDEVRDRAPEQAPGRRRAMRSVLWIWLVLVGVVAVVLTFIVVRDFIEFDHAVRHPEDGFSDWQCAAESGTCAP